MNIPTEYNLQNHLSRKVCCIIEEEVRDIIIEQVSLKEENRELKKQNAKLQTTVKQLKDSLHSIQSESVKATNRIHSGIMERIFRNPWEEKQQ